MVATSDMQWDQLDLFFVHLLHRALIYICLLMATMLYVLLLADRVEKPLPHTQDWG